MYYGYHKSQFVCVNANAQASGNQANQNGALFYPTTTSTTAPVPGYKPFFELNCVTCAGYTSGKAPPSPPPAAPVVAQGETFVRWGRLDCPGNAQLLFAGVAAGSWYNQGGNGANLQCLPPTAEFAEGKYDSADSSTADLYRAEYHTSGFVRCFLDRGAANVYN